MVGNPDREYRDFIEEAYIKPIRSVLIIDDDYPTIEEVLKNELGEKTKDKGWRKNPEQILRVIEKFRSRDPSYIVDIHDGEKLSDKSEEMLANHLHQSDLLILDYELNDDGQKAIEIANKVFSNRHFNLIVVHTSSETIAPFKFILLSLLGPFVWDAISKEYIEQGKQVVQEAEDDDPEISRKVLDSIDFAQYAAFRDNPKQAKKNIRSGQAPFGALHRLIEENNWQNSVPGYVFLWAISEYENSIRDVIGDGALGTPRWSDGIADNRLWIRSNQGFIAFVHKAKTGEIDLLSELHNSLAAWGPSPSRMLSAILRAKIEDEGVIAEDKILSGSHIHAKFYHNLLNNEKESEERRSLVEIQIDRQLEYIVNQIKTDVTYFMNEVVASDMKAGKPIDVVRGHYGVDLDNANTDQNAVKMFNSYVSCKSEISGWHLQPGHIFDIGEEKWVCLSPICDLVPTQKNSGIYGDVGDKKPFIAVQLHRRNGNLDSKKINSNSFVFLPSQTPGEEIIQFGFYAGDDADPEQSISPHWNLFMAADRGRFGADKKVNISKIKMEKNDLTIDELEVSISCQLRYEYALNLMQKFGPEFTRVGLGFISG